MNPFVISCILIVITALPLGYFVYAQSKDRWANRLWFFYSLSLSVWGVFGTLIGLTDNPEHALIYWRIAMGIIWMPVLFYHFAYLYAPWKEKKMLIGAYVITGILALSAATPYYITHVEWVFDSFYYAQPGIAFYILTVWWFLLTGYSHTKLYRDSKKMPHERQNQIKYFIVASTIGYLGGFHDFSIVYGINIYPWSNFLIVLYPFIMAYAIVKHGLFDIFIFIKRAFYSAIFVGVIALFVSNVGFINSFLQAQFGFGPWITPLIAGIVSLYLVYLFLDNSRKTDQAKQEFITVAAHKLRTPLTHIQYITEELEQEKTKEETRALVQNLKESNNLLIELINKLLNVTNLETRSEKYNFTSLNLESITASIIKSMNSLNEFKKINIEVTTEENIPLAEGQEKSIKFVIQSLIENALIYTPSKGTVKIKLSRDKKNVIWSITDSGIGIAPEDMSKVFEKFFRSKDALVTETEGTGLALFMSRNLIKRQGGDIKVESGGLGQGSRFWFTLPIKG